jgi:uncharacterized protein (TIGR02246 family)
MSRSRATRFLLAAALLAICPPAIAGPFDDQVKQAYAAWNGAFNKGDAKAVAAFWTPDGDYVDPLGRTIKGRAAIEKLYENVFARSKGAKLTVVVTSTRMVGTDAALQDGITDVQPADGGPATAARFSAVLVKKDGAWYFESVRESVVQRRPVRRPRRPDRGVGRRGRQGRIGHGDLRLGREPELHRLDFRDHAERHSRRRRDAVDRLGRGRQAGAVVVVLLRRRLRRSGVDEGRRQVGEQGHGQDGRRQEGDGDEHPYPGRRRPHHLATEQRHRGRPADARRAGAQAEAGQIVSRSGRADRT